MQIKEIKGIGPKTELALKKLGIETTKDLLNHYPFRFEDLSPVDPNTIQTEENVTIKGIVESIPTINFFKGKMNRMSFNINSNNQIIKVTIFNRAYLKNSINIGQDILITGKYDPLKKIINATNIRLKETEEEIVPIYHTVKGLSNAFIRKSITNILPESDIEEPLPKEILSKYNFMPKKEALYNLHLPKSKAILNKAIDRIKYEELFIFMLKVNNMIQNNKEQNNGLSRVIHEEDIEAFKETLPFTLTADQNTSLMEIINDLSSKKRMNRLLLGDVGSGKTVVAIGAIYANFLAGYQSALMAPTEILAKQHFETIKSFLKDYNINIELLTSSTKAKEKKEIFQKLKDNKIDLIIGTHALINDEMEFANLGLVITDEQHRFGVRQRENLKNKGKTADILYLSATPIPRTYALTIYGDMDISLIKTVREGKKPINTSLVKQKDIKLVLLHMLEEIKKGHQVYIISPLIEGEETTLKTTEILKENIEKAFNNKIEAKILHGRMKSKEKDEIMNDFKEKKYPILISTTVIEVGIDIKDATMIVIFNAERFGLSTLHQLRGRVGRNNLQSYCYLVSDSNHPRLTTLTKETDGFKIAEADFNLRGHGDLFGTMQSGEMIFKLADLKEDYELLLKAKKDSEVLINEKSLPKNLKEIIEKNNNLA